MIASKTIFDSTLKVLFGILLSVFVLFQSVQVSTSTEEAVDQTEQNDTEETPSSILSQANAINQSSTQINLGFESYLLDELIFNENEDTPNSVTDLISSGIHKTIQVIIKKIVAPNAP